MKLDKISNSAEFFISCQRDENEDSNPVIQLAF